MCALFSEMPGRFLPNYCVVYRFLIEFSSSYILDNDAFRLGALRILRPIYVVCVYIVCVFFLMMNGICNVVVMKCINSWWLTLFESYVRSPSLPQRHKDYVYIFY